jgi:GNAT superfamily N-acetyltransferase
MSIEVRAATLDRGDGLQLLQEFANEIAGLYPGWTPTTGPSADPSEFLPPTGLFVIAYRDGVAVGCGGYKKIHPQYAEIKRLYVRPECRGEGVARRILERLEEGARQVGFQAVRLDTGDRQPDALDLFERSGYQPIPDYNDNPFASFWFEKVL